MKRSKKKNNYFSLKYFFFTYIDILQLPNVQMDISATRVTNSVLFHILDTAVNKDVSVVNPGVTFLLDAILNKWASYFFKNKTS